MPRLPQPVHVGPEPGQGVRLREGKVVPLVLEVEAEAEAQDEVVAVDRGAVVEHVLGGHALPPRRVTDTSWVKNPYCSKIWEGKKMVLPFAFLRLVRTT